MAKVGVKFSRGKRVAEIVSYRLAPVKMEDSK